MAASLRSSRRADDVIGLLDVGTSKTVCVIVAAPQTRAAASRRLAGVRVLGVGHQPSRGLKAGFVMELDEAEQAVRAAVMQAERMAGVTLEDVFLAVACGRLKSSTFTANTEIEGRVVGSGDIERLMAAGRTYAAPEGRTLLHMNCISYRLDGTTGIADVRGMAGSTLGADLHAVTADDAPLHNLLHVIERGYFTAAGMAPAPLASGLAATTAEERQLGAVCIDFGAGTTAVSIFAEGHLLWTDVVPVGGNHVTSDIARALSTEVVQAERIKKDCGTLARAASDDHEAMFYTVAGQQAPTPSQTTKGEIREIVRGRMTSLLRHVAERIESSGVARYAAQRMVLTGGASHLPGLTEFAAEVFGRPARVARIEPLAGMPPAFCSPAFSTAAGLAQVAVDPAAGVRWGRDDLEPAGYLRRMGRWLQESF